MTQPSSLETLLQRVRTGDAQAAADILQTYEPALRREARMGLRNSNLRRVVGSSDILQQAMATFFVRVAVGAFVIKTPQDLLALLIRIVRNKAAKEARRAGTVRRGGTQEFIGLDGSNGPLPVVARQPAPDSVVAWREMLNRALGRFSAEERQLAELRAQGYEWTEIAARVGGTPDGCRMQHKRALARVREELGWEDGQFE